ncbi:MAG: hypothetical protein H8E15_09175 [Planctomycetes bacterium]|nr:hypothetical protein [Planctomycetota bacterium]
MKSAHNFHSKHGRRRRLGRSVGFTMVECVIAIMVINLTIAGLFQLLKLQEKQVAEAEGWLSKNPIYYLNPDPDLLSRALGKPASLDIAPVARVQPTQAKMFEVQILTYQLDLNPLAMTVVFEQRDSPTVEGQESNFINSKQSKGDKDAKAGRDSKNKELKVPDDAKSWRPKEGKDSLKIHNKGSQ